MKHDRNSPEYQRAVDSFVRQNINVCLSSLVAELTKGYAVISDTQYCRGSLASICKQAVDLCSPVLDYEEAARQSGYRLCTLAEFSAADDLPAGLRERAAEYSGSHIFYDPRDDQDGFLLVGTREEILAEIPAVIEEPYEWEIFEHWSVSEWLAEKLEAKGERVDRDFAGLCVWGRTCTGQSIASDDVICDTYDEMMEG